MNPKLLLIKRMSQTCKSYREHTALVSLISACVLCSDRCRIVSRWIQTLLLPSYSLYFWSSGCTASFPFNWVQ